MPSSPTRAGLPRFLDQRALEWNILGTAVSRPFWPAVFILVLASAARLFWATWHSVDLDEAFSLYWARTPLGQMIPDLLAFRGDPHPPGYYAILKPWVGLVGANEVGLRLLSISAGLLFVALLYRLGRQLFGPGVGLAAALLASVNPALVYESLDARMYMPAAALVLGGVILLWRFLDGGRWTAGAGAWALLTAAAYHHFAGALAIAGIGAAVFLARFSARATLRGLAPLALAGLAYTPYAFNAWRISGSSGSIPIRSAPTVTGILEFSARWALFHEAHLPRPAIVAGAGVVWLAIGWGLLQRKSKTREARFLLGLLLVPLLLYVILSMREPILQPKMLVVTTLAFLLIGAALGGRGWWIAVLLLAQLWGYSRLWEAGRQRENWRAAGQFLQEHVGPDDVVLTHLHFYEEPLRFYYDGPIVAPFGSRLSLVEEVEPGLQPFLGAEVLWLAQSGTEYTDPDKLLENWLADRYPLVTAVYPNHIAIKGYLLNQGRYPPLPGTRELGVRFTDGAQVQGIWLDAAELTPTDIWLHPPSNWLHVALYATPAEYRLTLEDVQGAIWGANLPPSGARPPAGPESVRRLDYDINLNPETPAGEYKVVLRLLEEDNPIPRADNGENYLIVGVVWVVDRE